MYVAPVASDGDGENQDDDYDEAEILQPFVRLWRTAHRLVLAMMQRFDPGAIVTEQTPSYTGLRRTTISTRRLLALPSEVSLLAMG